MPIHARRFALLAFAALLLGAGGTPAAQQTTADQAEMVKMLVADAQRHERGDGVQRDTAFAAALYCKAARMGDAESQFQLGWMYAWGRGVARNDAWAAYLFRSAAEQGIAQAPNMLRLLGDAVAETPECMREPAPVPQDPAQPMVEVKAPKAIVALVDKMAPQYQVQPRLALAIMKAESNFDPQALSPKNAMGLMQLIPQTAQRFSVKNPYDAKQNIRGGLAYLRWLLAYFEGDVALVAAAYNAGEGAVDRYLGVPPYAETRSYVRRITDMMGLAAHPFDPKVTQPSPVLHLMSHRSKRAR